MRRLPLAALHAALGARFGEFAGWEMPLQYRAGLRAEHLHTRAAAGLFDVSHMGQLRVHGPVAALERALPVDFDGWPVGEQRYALLPNDAGGIADDLMVTRLADGVRIVVNAAQREADLVRLRALCPELAIEMLDAGLVALQGPRAEEALAAIEPGVRELRFMHARACAIGLVSRSGYTGEDGFEISVAPADLEPLAQRLLAHPAVAPVGLGARDTLRLEAGLPLYGQDLTEATTIVEAGLGWSVAGSRRPGGKKEGGFPGAEVYLKEVASGARRAFAGFLGEEPVPVRSRAALVDAAGRAAGVVTSGTVSPSTGRAVMMGYVEAGVDAAAELFAVVREKPRRVRRVGLPFVEKRYRR
ncbi:MAG TPA: glycine cleavage system aminomethyltransferase GcvT [Burkholderiales bacterium]|nr:glycine cleavage system aminomethyltransferase GcvT [Burkholderiales bacterium]